MLETPQKNGSGRLAGQRIIVTGPYGANNIGDDVLGKIICDELHQRGGEITVASDNPRNAEEIFSQYPIVERLNLRSGRLKLIRHLKSHDVLVVGGGEQLSEPRIPNPVYGHLATNLQSCWLARQKRMKFATIGVGVDSNISKIGRLSMRKILKHAAFLGVRDTASQMRLINIVGNSEKNIFLGADPAFLLSNAEFQDSVTKVHSQLDLDSNLPLVVVVISVDKKHSLNIVSSINALVQSLANNGINVVYASSDLQIGYDRTLYENRLMDCPAGVQWLPPHATNTQNFLKLISQADCVISSRMHPLIFGLASQKPIVCISRAAKMSSLMNTLNLPYLEIEKTTSRSLIDATEVALKQQDSFLEKISVPIKQLINLANQQFDEFADKLSQT